MNKKQDNYYDRLRDWKFGSALKIMPDCVSDSERELVEALAILFGNTGWFDGKLRHIISVAVDSIIGDEDE